MSKLFWLTDAHMARLRHFFPKSHGKLRVDDRCVLSGIIFIDRNGLRWCDAPKDYGLRRVCRRLELLSRMEHQEQADEQVFPRGARARGGIGSGQFGVTSVKLV